VPGAERLRLQWRPYRFTLPQAMVTSQGAWSERCGWLLRLEAGEGRLGWGEAAADPANGGAEALAAAIAALTADLDGQALERQALEALLPSVPASMACAIGMALAELDGLGSPGAGGWRSAPPSALLLPAGEAMLPALDQALAAAVAAGQAPTVKWKVAAADDGLERRLLEALLQRLPPAGRLRLDANGGWDRPTAVAWARRLAAEPRLDWLEQPLPPGDPAGLEALAVQLPVALDESLRDPLGPPAAWPGWQVRRPLLEGDPRPLLAALQGGTPRLMLSTALETGIGARLLQHLAALQVQGPTPTAPGLAPGWCPGGDLFAADPERVWGAVA
jgi:o-succinylbenzoate synthase